MSFTSFLGLLRFPVDTRSVIPVLCNAPALFSDGTHLNANGAEKYSRIVASDIKRLMNEYANMTASDK